MLKIILTTGGTGGHIFPALATAEAITKRNPDAQILFIGSLYGPEGRLATNAGLDFIGLPSRGFLGRGLRAIPASLGLIASVVKAISAIRKFKPCAVAAFGGYAAFAPALAAHILGIPLLLHEQNAIVGVSNRILSRWADTICASLPDTQGFAKPNVVTGNPVRCFLARTFEKTGRKTKRLLILGGSQGAHALNEYIIGILPELKEAGIDIWHQTGMKDLEKTQAAYAEAGYDPKWVKPFIDDIAAAYAWADLALCRAGASTVAELCMAGLPSILVPFPAAIHDHQTRNAKVLADAGAAVLLPEDQLEEAKPAILHFINTPVALADMSKAAADLAKPDAADLVAAEIENLCVHHSAKKGFANAGNDSAHEQQDS